MSEDKTKFVVYTAKIGKTGPGIRRAHVSIVDDRAFVHKAEKATQADVLPATAVYDTQQEAEAYLAGTGAKRWVVGLFEEDGQQVPMMFLARVVIYEYYGRYNLETRYVIRRLAGNKEMKVLSRYEFHHFANKKQAEKHFGVVWREHKKDIATQFNRYAKLLELLEKHRPRSRKTKL